MEPDVIVNDATVALELQHMSTREEEEQIMNEQMAEVVLDQVSELEGACQMNVAVMGDEMASEANGDLNNDKEIVIRDKRLPYDIVMMEDDYGEGHRGAVANMRIETRDIIQVDTARVYVSHSAVGGGDIDDGGVENSRRTFFNGQKNKPHNLIPKRLATGVKGGIWIALTGCMVRDNENMALMIISPTKGLHGRIDTGKCEPPHTAYKLASKLYFKGFNKKKRKRWNEKMFTRLYAVLQLNAFQGYVPLSNNVFGVGFFSGSVYFNHSCAPNAIAVMMPGKLCVQALMDIEVGEEITIAYREVAVDLLAENMCRTMHFNLGISMGKGRCVCKLCSLSDENEEKVITDASGGRLDSKSLDRVVDVDLAAMWTEETIVKLENNSHLRALVISMVRDYDGEEGASAAASLRQAYPHFLDGEVESDYCPDLALVLGELYCTGIIHVPHQFPEDLHFWPRVYLKAVNTSRLQLPTTLGAATLARAYGAMLAYGSRHKEDKENQQQDMTLFLMHWVACRCIQANMHGHTAYLTLPCKTYDILDTLCVQLHDNIMALERQMKISQETEALRQAHLDETEAFKQARADEDEALKRAHDAATASSSDITPPVEMLITIEDGITTETTTEAIFDQNHSLTRSSPPVK